MEKSNINEFKIYFSSYQLRITEHKSRECLVELHNSLVKMRLDHTRYWREFRMSQKEYQSDISVSDNVNIRFHSNYQPNKHYQLSDNGVSDGV